MKNPRRLKMVAIGAGSLLALALVLVVVGYLLAPHFYLTRTIFWGESDYKDLRRFPARTIHNAPPVFRFERLAADNPYATPIEAIGDRSTNGSFEDYLDARRHVPTPYDANPSEHRRTFTTRHKQKRPILAAQTSRPIENWRPAWNITETSESSPCPTTLGTQACGWARARSTFFTTASEKRCDLRAGGRASPTCDTR
jgi:hypothetical protein